MAQFFPPSRDINVDLPRLPPPWTFYRAAANSSLFSYPSSNVLHDSDVAYEKLLGTLDSFSIVVGEMLFPHANLLVFL